MKMSDPNTASTSREDETTLREKDILAIKLLRAIREKKVPEAKKILTENPNIHYKDKTGCQGLHYAAQEGFLDLVKTLIEEGAHVNCFDHNGQSPLHKASSRGHVDVVINLVANGAQIGSLDWNNHTPFEKAVISRSVGVVEILLMFGAEPNLQDWSWTMEKFGEKEIKIQELITDHVPLVPGYKYEGIQFEVVYVKPNEDITLDKLRLTLSAIDVRNPFIFFCRKMQSEYTDLKSLLHEDQTPYSDMFELRTWGVTRKTLSLKVIVEGIPKCNEHLFIVSHDRQQGRVDNFIKNEDENTTEVTLTIKMNTKGPTQFAIASVFKKETFAISEDEVVIKPTAEPEAEIDIPKGTFDHAAELQLNVVDTNDVNEDEEDESGPLLMTNVIDMSMSDGQQPKEEIVMKLPIHKKGNEVEEMCVLATSEEDPDDVDDWEVIEAQTDSKGKAAVFKIKHFSIYAVTKKKFANQPEQLQKVVESINNSLKGTKRVHFLVMTKWDVDSHFDVVIEIIRKKQSKDRKKHWTKEGYEALELSKECIIKKKQIFKILLGGDIEKDIETERKIEYHHNRQNNSIVARVIIQSIVEEPKVNIDIMKGEPVSFDQRVIVTERTVDFCKRQKTIIEQGETIEYEGFQKMNVKCIFPNVTYPVLEASSIQYLCNCFSLDEAGMFALQMDLPLSIKEELFNAQFPSKELAKKLFLIWRGSRHSRDRIKKIVRGLAKINRKDLVDAFDKAFKEDLPFPENLNV